jgi:hypothetical protein
MSQHTLETTSYEELGKERIQTYPIDKVPSYQKHWRTHGAEEIKAYDNYWRSRRDVRWVEFPGKYTWNKHVRKLQFKDLITEILMDLEPQSTFNPADLWTRMKNAATERAVRNRSKDEKMKVILSVTREKVNLLREVAQIRNSKARGDLMAINRSISIPEARCILLAEILNLALAEYATGRQDPVACKKLIFELSWVIEGIDGRIRENSVSFLPADIRKVINASLPADIQKDTKFLNEFMSDHWRTLKASMETDSTVQFTGKNTGLIADTATGIDNVLSRAVQLRNEEPDIIRFQLLKMSDCLPPLSRFVFGHSLDPWQIQVLRWIDDGKSVVISAPTSSGKTVLSTYVAVIFKSESANAAQRAAITNMAAFDEPPPEEVFAQEVEEDMELVAESAESFLNPLIQADASMRFRYLQERKRLLAKREASPRILFVVPTEPLVWQVAAYFTKLLRSEGDVSTGVGIVTEQLTFNPSRVFGILPQIVVGTPQALESALSKPRGLSGEFEASHMAAGDVMPGGFENFDWVVYDEVHALDGEEGAALQRIIRAVNCPFLALSATIGNADELKNWFEQVRVDQTPIVQSLTVPTVESIVHETRFINLQRYLWNQDAEPLTGEDTENGKDGEGSTQKRLQEINPLAAFSDADSLIRGELHHSSLSFTSKDCVRVWDNIRNLFPLEVIAELDPNRFFEVNERITLARLKGYEDLIKATLPRLAQSHPTQMNQLLAKFQVPEPAREANICELLLELKARDMTPCLPFHLNTFEAIKLFQHILGELEWMQHAALPTYYTDRMKDHQQRSAIVAKDDKSHGGNAKEAEEAARAGEGPEQVADVDVYEPHPQFILSKNIPLSFAEMKKLVDEIERFDGFKAREKSAMKEKPGENIAIMEHPLIRGLKRGIGLFIDEISFPSYRRAVQRLASEGKLGVVISDASLAFGVNMPFRTCIFCGEMNGRLNELMAQQMSGRAGRRGLDNQGNIIYTSLRLDLLRKLMIGKISDLTGQYDPAYETLALQPILSPRHVGYARANVIGGVSLANFLQGRLDVENTLEVSKRTLLELGFITPARNSRGVVQYIPNSICQYNYQILSIMWEMRKHPYESITLGMCFNRIVEDFMTFLRELRMNEKMENAKTRNEIMEPQIHLFFVIMTQLVCRVAWRERPELSYTPVKMQEIRFFSVDSRREVYDRWTKLFAMQQGFQPPETDEDRSALSGSVTNGYEHLRDPVTPSMELDGTLLMCCLDAKYVHTLDDVHKQEMKELIWQLGCLIKIMHNCAKTNENYVRFVYFVLNNAFKKMKNLLAELVIDVVDFSDCSSYGVEHRRPRAAVVTGRPTNWNDMNGREVCEELLMRLRNGMTGAIDDSHPPKESEDWCDLRMDSWVDSMKLVLEKVPALLAAETSKYADGVVPEEVVDSLLWKLAYEYRALSRSDLPLMRLSLNISNVVFDSNNTELLTSVANALASSSFAKTKDDETVIGTAIWFCYIYHPAARAVFPTLIQLMVQEKLLGTSAILTFLDEHHILATLPMIPSTYCNFRVNSFYAEKVAQAQDAGLNVEDWEEARQHLMSYQLSWADAFKRVLEAMPVTESVEVVKRLSHPYASTLNTEADWQLLILTKNYSAKKIGEIVPLFAKIGFWDQHPYVRDSNPGLAVLATMTYYITQVVPGAVSATSMFLKFLYDSDIVDEEAIIAWHKTKFADLLPFLPSTYVTSRIPPDPANKFAKQAEVCTAKDSPVTAKQWEEVLKAANQMVDWLQQAEEDEDEEEEEEDA